MSRTHPPSLSLADRLWAKTLTDRDTGELIGWLPLPVHLRDTGETARLLLRHRKSRQHLTVLQSVFPPGFDLEALAWLLGALHDLGKAGPNFSAQSRVLAEDLYRQSMKLADDGSLRLDTSDRQEIANQSEFPHSLASEIIAAKVLATDFGLSSTTAPPASAAAFGRKSSRPRQRPLPIVHQLTSMLGSHHGMTANGGPTAKFIRSSTWTALLGTSDSPWPDIQQELARTLIRESGIDFDAGFWHDESFRLDRGVLSLLSSIVIEADWIASDHTRFPLITLDEDITACESSSSRAARAWAELDLPALWVPDPSGAPASADTALHTRFPMPASVKANPGQALAFTQTLGLQKPAMLILEDETGKGKTEAGLLAAENLARATGASGVFIGLPTQATTNGMFSRAAPWVNRLLTVGDAPSVAVTLAHSKSTLNQDWRALPRMTGRSDLSSPQTDQRLRQPHPPQLDDEEATGTVGIRLGNGLPDESHVDDEGRRDGPRRNTLRPGTHSWLSGRKKRLLSDFVIGTIDQLLMGALRARHLMLRHSGLADKVVVIDEVHAADATMRLFLCESLVWLGRWGVPVVVLTATLSPAQKSDLISAYQDGLARRTQSAYDNRDNAPSLQATPATGSSPTSEDSPETIESSAGLSAYPAITLATESEVETTPIPHEDTRIVQFQEFPDDEDTLVTKLRSISRDGGCIAVIRNSVARVQATARRLRAEFGAEAVTVAHARFAASDRAHNDRQLLADYGKDSSSRPHFSIVVASQVIEQSLDIDFDAVFTDMCPVDLLIQRLGRVHRHPGRTRPAPLEQPMCFITGIEDTELHTSAPTSGAPTFTSDSELVYGRHLLLRSLAALRLICPDGSLASPEDVAPLVHTVYGDGRLGPDGWQSDMAVAATTAAKKESDARELAHRWVTEPDQSIHGLDDWLNDNDGDPEDTDPHNRQRGSVRDGTESIEVLLVLTDGTGWRTLDWLPRTGGKAIPLDGEVPRHIAEAVANSSIRLPFSMSQGKSGDAVVDELEKLGISSWQRSPLLRGQLVLPLAGPAESADGGDALDEETYHAQVGKWNVTYDRTNGLIAERVRDPS